MFDTNHPLQIGTYIRQCFLQKCYPLSEQMAPEKLKVTEAGFEPGDSYNNHICQK